MINLEAIKLILVMCGLLALGGLLGEIVFRTIRCIFAAYDRCQERKLREKMIMISHRIYILRAEEPEDPADWWKK